MADVNQDLDEVFKQAAAESKLPVNFLKAIAQQESGFNPKAVSPQGAQGIMQMLPATAAEMGAKDPFDPLQAIPAAARYLRQGYDATGSLQGASAYYHGGPDTRQWGPKTKAYVQSIGGILSQYNEDPASAAGSAPPSLYASLGTGTIVPLSDAGIQPLPASQKAPAAPAKAAASQSDDDLLKLYAKPGVVSAPAAGGTPPAASAQVSDDDLLKLYSKPDAPVAAVAPPVPPPQGQPGLLANAPSDSTAGFIPAIEAGAKNVATGVVKGAGDTVGVVGNTKNLADYILARVQSARTGQPVDQVLAQQQTNQAAIDNSPTLPGRIAAAINPMNYLPDGQQVANKLLSYTGEYVPQSTAERMVQSGVQAASGSLGPGVRGVGSAAPTGAVNMLTNAARTAPITAISGATAQGATDLSGDPLIGLAAGVAPGMLVSAAGGGVNRLVGSTDPRSAALARNAQSRGINLGLGQLSDNPTVRFMDSVVNKIPGSGGGAMKEAQQTAFNRSVAQTFGEDAARVTPDVMGAARTRIGRAFDDVAVRTPAIQADHQFMSDIRQTLTDAHSVLPAGEVTPIANQIQNVVSAIDPNTGTLSGQTYQALTRRGAPLDRALSSDNPNIRFYAGEVRDALDGAMQRSAPPDVAADLTQARAQWRNMRTIEDLVAKSPTGDISPAALQGRVNANNKGTYGAAYGGGGDLKQLADIGQRFLKEPPSSGTAERTMGINMLTGLGTAATGLLSAAATGQSAAPIVAATVGAPLAAATGARGIGALLRNQTLSSALLARSLGQQAQPGVGNLLLGASLPTILQNRLGARVPLVP